MLGIRIWGHDICVSLKAPTIWANLAAALEFYIIGLTGDPLKPPIGPDSSQIGPMEALGSQKAAEQGSHQPQYIIPASRTTQLPCKGPQIPSDRDHKTLNRGTLGGLGLYYHSIMHIILYYTGGRLKSGSL